MKRTYIALGVAGLLAAGLLFYWFRSQPAQQPSTAGVHPEIDKISELLSDDPENDSLYHLRGMRYWELQAYDEAIADAVKAIQIDSVSTPKYYHLLADALLDYGRPNDSRRAIEVLDKACRIFPEDFHTYLKASEFLLIVRQHGEALKKLDHILQRDPINAEAYYMTGRIALDMGDTTRSIKSFHKAVQLDANNPDAWIFLGRLYTAKQDPNALQFYDNALRLEPENIEYQELKAAHFKRLGQFDKAFELYRQIIINHPDYSNAFYDMGLIYLEMDSLDKATEHFNRAIQTDPLYFMAYYYRGVSKESKGDLEGAIADYTQANKMSPNSKLPQEALERLKVKK